MSIHRSDDSIGPLIKSTGRIIMELLTENVKEK